MGLKAEIVTASWNGQSFLATVNEYGIAVVVAAMPLSGESSDANVVPANAGGLRPSG